MRSPVPQHQRVPARMWEGRAQSWRGCADGAGGERGGTTRAPSPGRKARGRSCRRPARERHCTRACQRCIVGGDGRSSRTGGDGDGDGDGDEDDDGDARGGEAAPPGPAVRARRPHASGGHPTSPTCRPSARSRGPAVYVSTRVLVFVCFTGLTVATAYSTQQTAIAAGTVHRATVDEHAAHSVRRRAKHASTSVFHCAITDSDLKTARHAEQTQTHTTARRNGASAHCAPPDVRGKPSECVSGGRRQPSPPAASHTHRTARPRWAGRSPGADVAWGGPSRGADVGRGGPSPGADVAVNGALERSVSCARIVDAVRVFSAGRIFSQNLPPSVVEYPRYPGVPLSTLQQQAGKCSKSRRRCGRGEPSPGAGASVAQASTSRR